MSISPMTQAPLQHKIKTTVKNMKNRLQKLMSVLKCQC